MRYHLLARVLPDLDQNSETLTPWQIVEACLKSAAKLSSKEFEDALRSNPGLRARDESRRQFFLSGAGGVHSLLRRLHPELTPDCPNPNRIPTIYEGEQLQEILHNLDNTFQRQHNASDVVLRCEAYGVAEAFDRCFGAALFDPEAYGLNGDEIKLRPNDLMPIVHPPRWHKSLKIKSPSPITRLTDNPRLLMNCQLVPEFNPDDIDVCLDLTYSRLLLNNSFSPRAHYRGRRKGAPGLKCGVAVLNYWDEFDLGMKTVNDAPHYAGVHPSLSDSEMQCRMRQVLDWASNKVDVLLFPELSMTRGQQDWLITEFQRDAQLRGIKLVTAGSVHLPDVCDFERNVVEHRNVSHSIAADSGVPGLAEIRLSHHKIHPFDLIDTNGITRKELLLNPGRNRLTIYVGPHCSVVKVICKDFLNQDLRRMIEDLRPSLLLLPSMTELSSSFVHFAQEFTNATQGMVLFGNARTPWRSAGGLGKRRYPEHDGMIAFLTVPNADSPIRTFTHKTGRIIKTPFLVVLHELEPKAELLCPP